MTAGGFRSTSAFLLRRVLGKSDPRSPAHVELRAQLRCCSVELLIYLDKREPITSAALGSRVLMKGNTMTSPCVLKL